MRKLRVDGKPLDVGPYLGQLEERLRAVPGLVGAYLYGSYGTPYQTPLSDVDLALVYRRDAVPTLQQELQTIGVVTETLHEDDVSVTTLNRVPLALQFKVLETGRRLLCTDEIALADFVEEVIDRYGDFAIDYERFCREYDAALVADYGGGRGAG